MAKRKKATKRRTTRRKRGMGSVPGGYTKRALCLLSSIAAANLAQEGMAWLYDQPFMAQKVEEGKAAPKINIKQALTSGGAMLLSGAGSVVVKNDYASAALQGIAVVGSVQFKEDVVKPVIGLGGVDDFLELYKTKDAIKRDLNGDKKVQLAGEQKIALA